jgi:acetoin utilization deacetylase AcuC-like enzyme
VEVFTSSAFADINGMEPALADKAAALHRMLAETSPDGVAVRESRPASAEEARLLHDGDYVDAVMGGAPAALATSCGMKWHPHLPVRALASLATARDAASAAMRDGAGVGLFSGEHHAHPGRGAGYCVFNGTALAARTACDHGAARVLVVDLDAHCGGGTVAVLRGDRRFRHVDVSVDNFDDYVPSPSADLHMVGDADDYLETIERALASVPSGWADAVVYTNGVDPHEHDSHGGLDGISDMVICLRERILFDWVRKEGVPVAVMVAGGYASFRTTPDNVARLHMIAIEEAAACSR